MKKRGKIPQQNLLDRVAVDYRPIEAIVDPDGALLCHGDELKGGGNTSHRIGAPHDRTVGEGLRFDTIIGAMG